MRYYINIPRRDYIWSSPLILHDGYQRIECKDVVIFDICKVHNHRYDLLAFFYERKVIIGLRSYRTKKELYGAIQKFLQEYL